MIPKKVKKKQTKREYRNNYEIGVSKETKE